MKQLRPLFSSDTIEISEDGRVSVKPGSLGPEHARDEFGGGGGGKAVDARRELGELIGPVRAALDAMAEHRRTIEALPESIRADLERRTNDLQATLGQRLSDTLKAELTAAVAEALIPFSERLDALHERLRQLEESQAPSDGEASPPPTKRNSKTGG